MFLNYASLPRSIYIVISCVGAWFTSLAYVCHHKLYHRFVARFVAAADRSCSVARAAIVTRAGAYYLLHLLNSLRFITGRALLIAIAVAV